MHVNLLLRYFNFSLVFILLSGLFLSFFFLVDPVEACTISALTDDSRLLTGGNICKTLNLTQSYQSVLIFKKNCGTGFSTQSIGTIEDNYSVQASMPVINNTAVTYVLVEPRYTKEWVSSLAKSLGMSGDIRETDDAFYAGDADSQEYYFMVRKDTSTISFQKFNGRSGLPQSKDSSIAAVDVFLRENGLLPQNSLKPDVLNNVAESISPSGERHVDWKTNVVTYPQMIDGLPVFNAQFNVEVDSDNNIIGLWRNLRDYEPYQEITLKSPEEAFCEFKTRHDLDKNKKTEKTTVTYVSFGYVMETSADGEGFLLPVYIFGGNDKIENDLFENLKFPFEPVTIEGKKDVTLIYNLTKDGTIVSWRAKEIS